MRKERSAASLSTASCPGKNLPMQTNVQSVTIQRVEAILCSLSGASIFAEAGSRAFPIENAGASMPEKSLAGLFTPFHRAERSCDRKSGGGLGPYSVKPIFRSPPGNLQNRKSRAGRAV
jgi:hypothetical protein